MSDETTMPEMPVRITTPDTSDMRLIAEMRFGVNYSPPTPRKEDSREWTPTPEQEQEQAWVREYLASCMCVHARDIETLGCTGVAKFEAGQAEAVKAGTRLRLGLGGGGVGLPCFVPPTRFCLVHNTVGGLQEWQMQHHPEYVNTISRALTPQERIQVGLTDKARRMRGGDRTTEAMDVLSGQNQDVLEEVASGLEDVHDEKVLEERELNDSGPVPFVPSKTWKCIEHSETNWECRYCLAQAVVEGPLDPVGFLHLDESVERPMQDLEDALATSGASIVEVYVRVATFTRKLARS